MKKNLFLPIACLLTAGAMLSSCASSQQKNIDQRVAAEPTVKNIQELAQKEDDTIESANNITAEQKTQLVELRQASHDQVKAIQQESLKLRNLLVKDLVAENYDSQKANEVSAIKTKLGRLERQRWSVMVQSVEKAQKILGRQAKDNQIMMNQFLERDYDNHGTY